MKRIDLVAFACIAALAAGCNGRRTDNTMTERRTIGTTGTTEEVSRSDRNFVNEQLAGGRTEVNLAKMAKMRAVDPAVTKFATMMINDHTKAGDRLKQIAERYSIALEPPSNDREKAATEKLSKLTGADFDKAYIKMMVDDHEKDVRDLRSRVDEQRSISEKLEGKNPANPATITPEKSKDTVTMSINEWAAATLPTVENHLNRAKQILDYLEHPTATSGTAKAPGAYR